MDLASVDFIKQIFESVYFFFNNPVFTRTPLSLIMSRKLRNRLDDTLK
jgi:hypothetical protein